MCSPWSATRWCGYASAALKTYESPPLKIDGLLQMMHTCPLKKRGSPKNSGVKRQPTDEPSNTFHTSSSTASTHGDAGEVVIEITGSDGTDLRIPWIKTLGDFKLEKLKEDQSKGR